MGTAVGAGAGKSRLVPCRAEAAAQAVPTPRVPADGGDPSIIPESRWGRMGPALSQHGVTLSWGDTACPGVGRGLPSRTIFQCPGPELGFSRAFSQFPSAHCSLQSCRV